MPTIDVLLATYNGARFLLDQLRSLEEQDFADWRLIVRDDGSTDGSLDVVQAWARAVDKPLRVIEDGRKGLGATGNFAALLAASEAPYFAFCDQDDVWLPEKLSLMVERLKRAEAAYGKGRPLLAYSDLRVVDENLQLIHPSFREYASLERPRADRLLRTLMLWNVVTGCASVGNAAIRQMALPVPAEAVVHDWWLALIAAGVGELIDVPEATVLYRQHGANAIGATNWTSRSVLLHALMNLRESFANERSFVADSQRQARAFQDQFGKEIDEGNARILRTYGWLHAGSLAQRKSFLFEHGIWSRRLLRNAALLAVI